MEGPPVKLATQEAEAGDSLEPGRWRLQWAEIVPLHSNLDKKSETPSKKKKRVSSIEMVILFLCICVWPRLHHPVL